MAKPDFSTFEENVVCKTEDRAYILKVTNENIDFPLFVWILLYQDLENKGLLGENELFQAVIICRSLINRQGEHSGMSLLAASTEETKGKNQPIVFCFKTTQFRFALK